MAIELAQRAGGSIARVGEHLVAGGCLRLVEPPEFVMAEIDLAAHVDHVGHVACRSAVRDLLDGLDIGGDVLAFRAVAAGRRLDEPAAVVAERIERPSILGSAVKARSAVGDLEEAAHPLDELATSSRRTRCRARAWARVADLAEAFGRCGADAAGGAVGADQRGNRASMSAFRRRSAS